MDEIHPLSLAQEPIWAYERATGGSAEFNMGRALTVQAHLDENALSGAISEIIARHPALRSVVVSTAAGDRIAVRPPEPLTVSVAAPCAPDQVASWAAAEKRRPFSLDQAPLLRAAAMPTDADSYVLVVTVHHLAGDARSLDIVMSELSDALARRLEGAAAPEPATDRPYAEFVRWQRDWLSSPACARQIGRWKDVLRDLPALPLLDESNLLSAGGSDPEPRGIELDAEQTRGLRQLCEREGVTLFTTVLTAFALALAESVGHSDIGIKVTTSGSRRGRFADVVGCFSNPVLVRCRVSAQQPCERLVREVHAELLKALLGMDVPFHFLGRELRRNLSRAQLPAGTTFGRSWRPKVFGGAAARPVDLGETGVLYGLDLDLRDRGESVGGSLLAADVVDEAKAEKTHSAFVRHLDQLTRCS